MSRDAEVARAGAFFDVDGTLLPATSCDRQLVRALRRGGYFRPSNVVRGFAYSLRAVRRGGAAIWGVRGYLAGLPVGDFETVCQTVAEKAILPNLAPKGLERLAYHRDRGDRVILMTGAPLQLAQSLGTLLRADVVIGGRLALRESTLTGWMLEATPRGHEKARHVRTIARDYAFDLSMSWAYANTWDDVPHMAITGHPVAVNPGPLLRRAIPGLGWPIEYWPSPTVT